MKLSYVQEPTHIPKTTTLNHNSKSQKTHPTRFQLYKLCAESKVSHILIESYTCHQTIKKIQGMIKTKMRLLSTSSGRDGVRLRESPENLGAIKRVVIKSVIYYKILQIMTITRKINNYIIVTI
jgi:hypothetical protein